MDPIVYLEFFKVDVSKYEIWYNDNSLVKYRLRKSKFNNRARSSYSSSTVKVVDEIKFMPT